MGCLASSLKKTLDVKQSFQIGKLIEQYIHELYIPSQIFQPDWESIWQLAFSSYGVQFERSIGLKHLADFVSRGGLYEYTLPLLETLSAQRTRLILLSNVTGQTEIFQQDLDNRGLTPYFERVIWSSEIGYRKPSMQAFQLALNSIGARASSTLMVGDSEIADIQGAKAVGIDAMLVSDQHVVSRDADYVVTRADVLGEIVRLTHMSPSPVNRQ
ncbi:HAD family hydrolase [Salinivibrio sp. ES.052]|uniref:HAD family hydrolase n=1 Tax=Salinivibrio sp. ES.052 TaxID=1882823 RepID=UPI0009266EA4|nr:HAD family hydrolase [Salinivibrio sp. ES.052]SIN91878.1 haloacid dehalogenase superfamily, subfamily IA, variant 1 with third motif having Dx(3-4)D or Dx(3-4)E [Salinivibrio sp. ES.052]